MGLGPDRTGPAEARSLGEVLLSGQAVAERPCPRCGYSVASRLPEKTGFHPWHVRDRGAVKAYVATLGAETREWLLVLYVSANLNLLAVDTIARGDIAGCRVNFARILCRGHALGAEGYILVHNHPSGDPTPSLSDIAVTKRLARASADLELPLLDHLIIAGNQMVSVGHF